ncbi:MAG TPA: ABC transporter substrate-binding protein [Myxococcales bacterium]|jgi:NitT/TauT family transport system substrate-binding protein|nr:ABC transporter substrate-binding protein [Myxococcales bacterium]
MKTILAILAALTASASAGRAAESVVKVGFCARTITSAAAPFAIATKKGWYAPAGIKVQLVPVAGSTDCVKLVATGDLPYSLPSIEPLPAAIQQGVKAKIFYTAYQGNIYGIAVPKESPIRSIKDLKGKKIGVASMGSGGVPVARGLLAMNGLDPEKDAQIVVVGEAAQAAALLRGEQVAALSLYDTQYALVDSAGVPVRMLDSGPVARFPSNGFLALQDTLQKDRAQAVALVKGYAMGTVFAIANPEAAVKIVYEVYPQTRPSGKSDEQALRDDVKTLLARAEHWKLEAGGVKRWGESSLKDFDAYQDFLLKWKVIGAKVPAAELITNDLIDEVNKFDAAAVAADAKAYK